MILSAIAAMASNRVIGAGNALPWEIPEDMKFFRDTTKGKVMIMGRKTFESFGKPLPNRFHIVISRSGGAKDLDSSSQSKSEQTESANSNSSVESPSGVKWVQSLPQAIEAARALIQPLGSFPDEVFVIGGGEIYAQSLPYLQRIYLTRIHREFPGDTRFPEFDESSFSATKLKSASTPVPFDIFLYQKR